MDTLLNDIFHAQPDALLMIAGLIFIGIAIVGSVKTYFDPGKVGRIAAGGVGAVLLIAGLFMYKPPVAAPSASANDAVAQSGGASGRDASGRNASGQGASGQGTTSACYVPGKWPTDLHKSMTIGDNCTNAKGEAGRAVAVNPVCTFTSGPMAGASEQANHLMYVGYNCTSTDHKSKGSVFPVAGTHG